jgi:DNA-binding CsgD family transcriptional regulator
MENLNPIIFGIAFTLFNKMRQPVLLTTTTGEVVHINESAKNLLRKTNLVSIKNNQLVLPIKYSQEYFDDCTSMEYEFNIFHNGLYKSELKLLKMTSSGQNESLYAFYSLQLPQPNMGLFVMRPLVMLIFYSPESTAKVDSTILTEVFGLTPGECKTAILLAEGLSQKEIAEKLLIKYDTVRKQLQTIYQKTSTNQQSELIRLMLHLPSNFAQDSDIVIVKTPAPKKIVNNLKIL